ncbi:MAG: MFS transporter, partial [Rhodoferax sp.]|nr:MFS transporter [Rhodoferax sp.]
AGIGVFSAASVLCALAPSLAWLVAARALQGVGAAVMMALTMAFVGDTVPKARTGSAMGLLGTMSAVGTAMGPSLGGLLIAGWGWPALFLVNLPLGLLAVVLAWRYLPADPVGARGRGAGFDPLGTVLLALALAAYALAMTAGSGRFGPLNLGLLLAAAVAGWWFVRTQARVASPLVPLAHFRDPALGAGFAMSALVTTVVMATMVVGPF